MTNKPFFTVIIPTYNREDHIQGTVDSVLKQTYDDLEVLIVDDGSTDKTEEIISRVADKRVVYLKKQNGERGAARNFGILRASGRYITFLDSDDALYPMHLSTAYNFLVANKSPEVFHVGYEIIASDNSVVKVVDNLKYINKEIIRGNPLSCMGVFVRNDIMQKNLFNEDRELSGLEDWELWLRMAAKYEILACNSITSAIRQHDERSVMANDPQKLVIKAEKFIQYVTGDKTNRQVFGRNLLKTSASVKTYVALHLAMIKASRKQVWQYLIQGIADYPAEMFRRRFLVILKLMLRG
jgi:glycosyltransferase involved in cell wall biosynthesis